MMAMMESRSCRCRSRVKSCVGVRWSWQGTHHPKHYNISTTRIEIIFFKIYFILENSWAVPGLEPPDGNPFHALIGVQEEEKESDEEEEDLEEDMEEEEDDGDEEEIHVT